MSTNLKRHVWGWAKGKNSPGILHPEEEEEGEGGKSPDPSKNGVCVWCVGVGGGRERSAEKVAWCVK